MTSTSALYKIVSDEKRMKEDKTPSLEVKNSDRIIVARAIPFLWIGFNSKPNNTTVCIAAGDAEMFV